MRSNRSALLRVFRVHRTLTAPAAQLLTIMSSSIAYLTSRSTFLQVSQEIPVTKFRNADKYDQPDVLEGRARVLRLDCPP